VRGDRFKESAEDALGKCAGDQAIFTGRHAHTPHTAFARPGAEAKSPDLDAIQFISPGAHAATGLFCTWLSQIDRFEESAERCLLEAPKGSSFADSFHSPRQRLKRSNYSVCGKWIE
jgi:hypothetical protein